MGTKCVEQGESSGDDALWIFLLDVNIVRAQILWKTNISDLLIRTSAGAYQGVRNVSFSENFAYVLNGWSVK